MGPMNSQVLLQLLVCCRLAAERCGWTKHRLLTLVTAYRTFAYTLFSFDLLSYHRREKGQVIVSDTRLVIHSSESLVNQYNPRSVGV